MVSAFSRERLPSEGERTNKLDGRGLEDSQDGGIGVFVAVSMAIVRG